MSVSQGKYADFAVILSRCIYRFCLQDGKLVVLPLAIEDGDFCFLIARIVAYLYVRLFFCAKQVYGQN